MKKIFTLIAACVFTAMSAWAETTTIYERGYETAWSADDIATTGNYIWGGNAEVSTKAYPYVSGNGGRLSNMTIAKNTNSILTYDAVWFIGGDGSNATNYTFFRLCDKIEFQAHTTNQLGNVVINGTSYTIANACGKNNNNRTDDEWTIHAVINTATNTLTELTVAGKNGTKKAAFSLSSEVYLGTTNYSTLAFGTYREKYSPYCGVMKLKIQEESQEVTTCDYTINYVLGETVVNTVTGTVKKDAEVNTLASFVAEGVKYYRVAGEAESVTIDTDKKEVNIAVRKANDYSWSITSSLSTTIASGTGIEGESVNYAYPKYVLDGTQLYSTGKQSTNPWWGNSLVLDADNKNVVITYSNPIENVVYYSEAEAIEGAIYTSANNAEIRCSGKAAGYANAPLAVTTLPAGKYILYTSIWGNAGTTINFFAGDQNILAAECKGYIVDCNSVEFTSYGNTVVSFSGANNSHPVDYIYIVKTGDATVNIEVNDNGTASYVAPCNLDFEGSDLKAYVATAVSETTITLAEVTKVAAGEAIVVKGESCNVNVIAEADAPATNLFKAGAYTVEAGDNIFALSKNDGKFHKVAEGVTIPEGKAYIALPATESKAISLNFDGDVTGIKTTTAAKQNTNAYNLFGQKVSANAKGIVIINGKKINNK